MRYTQLGARGPQISRVGYGAWGISGMDWGSTDDAVSRKALHRALDLGVTLVDTADVYGFGHADRLLARVLRERGGKGDVVIASKAGSDFYAVLRSGESGAPIPLNLDKIYLIQAVEKSLQRLGIDCLDVLQLHSPPRDMLERDEPWEALRILKEQGKIRNGGWSLQSFQETAQADLLDRYHSVIDVVQVRYNLLEREAERVLLPETQRLGIGVIARIPLLFGLLSGKFTANSRFGDTDHRRLNLAPEKLSAYLLRLQGMAPLWQAFPEQSKAVLSLRFCLTHPGVHAVIPGGKTPRQVEENCAAADAGVLPPEVMQVLVE